MICEQLIIWTGSVDSVYKTSLNDLLSDNLFELDIFIESFDSVYF